MESPYLIIKGATLHNLKNIDVQIPRQKMTVITGVSGSGKSTLAFDTIYAEGQRRYVESLSAYVRQFLGLMQKPPVESIIGLSPAIAIQQKGTSHNPRSTVGTVTEVHDYLRVLFARVGDSHCPLCMKPINPRSTEEVVEEVMGHSIEGDKLVILSPIVRRQKGTFEKTLEQLQKKGFSRVRVDGEIFRIEEVSPLEKNKKHDLEVVVDRLTLAEGVRARFREAVGLAMDLSEGSVSLVFPDKKDCEPLHFSRLLGCQDCDFTLPELSPRVFSFNSPLGACPTCEGLGFTAQFDLSLMVEPSLSLNGGAILVPGVKNNGYFSKIYQSLSEKFGFSLDQPFQDLSDHQKELLYHGSGEVKIKVDYEMENSTYSSDKPFSGLMKILKKRYHESGSESMKKKYQSFMHQANCESCLGARLDKGPLHVFLGGKNIHQVSDFSISDALSFFKNLNLKGEKALISSPLLKEIEARLGFLMEVGLEYLSLNREASTLSGGEMQRIRLATQIGSGLVGVLYILDEPSIGLHSRDNDRLIGSLEKLRDLGNTLIIVEHDEEMMHRADFLVDMGPGAGEEGGSVIYAGPGNLIKKCRESLTGKYLSGKEQIEIPKKRRPFHPKKVLKITGLLENNLKNATVTLPLGVFACVTGVSGSGKSSLVNDTLWPLLSRKLNHSQLRVGAYKSITGMEFLDKAIVMDQSPIGRTPRSNPATYTGIFNEIRDLFSQLKESQVFGYKPGRFSFNVPGGRCENCEGDGVKKIEMHLLPDVYVQCEVCQGKRFNQDTLRVKFKGFHIAQVLEMTVSTATQVFENIPKIRTKLSTLEEVGLGYIRLGQSSLTLSGGEAQRVKLSTELSRRGTGKTIYILDEPTTGLHFEDIKHLLAVLHGLVDRGNTVLVVEHNLDVIKTADYLIELGPNGGPGGGEVIFEGTPEEMVSKGKGYTSTFLKPLLKKGK